MVWIKLLRRAITLASLATMIAAATLAYHASSIEVRPSASAFYTRSSGACASGSVSGGSRSFNGKVYGIGAFPRSGVSYRTEGRLDNLVANSQYDAATRESSFYLGSPGGPDNWHVYRKNSLSGDEVHARLNFSKHRFLYDELSFGADFISSTVNPWHTSSLKFSKDLGSLRLQCIADYASSHGLSAVLRIA